MTPMFEIKKYKWVYFILQTSLPEQTDYFMFSKKGVGGNSPGKFSGQFSLTKSFLCTNSLENTAENQLQRMWLS